VAFFYERRPTTRAGGGTAKHKTQLRCVKLDEMVAMRETIEDPLVQVYFDQLRDRNPKLAPLRQPTS